MRALLPAVLVLAASGAALAACPDACPVAGGGSGRTDCLVEFDGVASARVRCVDGDPACDTDGAVNGACRFAVATCLSVADARLPRCRQGTVSSFRVRNGRPGSRRFDPQLAALEADVLATPLPAGATTCRAATPIYVGLRGKKRFRKTTLRLRTKAKATDGRRDVDTIRLTCLPSARLGTPTSTYALAKVVERPAELVGGPLARGRLGDVLLANDRLQVVIQQPGRAMFGVGTYGGNIIDADRQRPRGEERDSFEELVPQINVENTAHYTSVVVLADGSDGGPAVVRATGPDDLFDFVNASSVVEQAGFAFPAAQDDRDLPLAVQTDYVLEPGADAVRIETTLVNTGAAPLDLFLGDYLNGSGQLDLFQPGYGFGEPLVTTPCPPTTWVACSAGACDRCNLVAYAGEGEAAGVSYGYVHAANGSSSFSVSGVTASLLGNQVLLVLVGLATPNFHLEPAGAPGDALTVVRHFVVGDGSVASIASVRDALQGVVTGTLAGRVTSAGEPVADAAVAVIAPAPPGQPTVNVVSHFRTDADGRYRGTLAPGTYTLRANKDGRAFGTPDPAEVTVTANVETAQDFVLPGPGFLEVTVVDDGGAPHPAKVQLVGFDPSPDPGSTQDIAGVIENVTGVFSGQLGDPLPFGIAGVWFADKAGRVGPVEVEPGNYRVYVSRGPRYSLYEADVVVAPDTVTPVAATLVRVVDTPGFVAGDFHIHALDSPDSSVTRVERVATQLAEGIDFFTPSEHDIRVDFQPTVAAMGVGHLIATAPSAEITTFDYGHFNSWPVTVDPLAVNGGSVDWGRAGVAPGADFPSLGSFGLTPGEIFAAAQADPRPNLVQINHVESFFDATGLDIDTAEGDTGPPQSHAPAASRRLDPGVPNFFDEGFDALELWNGSQEFFLGENAGDWFNLLNQGILRTGVANSDTHERRTNGGAVRTWVASAVTDPGALAAHADALAASVVAGRAIGTNSLFFTPTIGLDAVAGLAHDGATLLTSNVPTLPVTVEIRAPLWAEFDRVELYVNNAPQRWDHDDDPATRPRYRVLPDVTLHAGTDFAITTVDVAAAIPGAGRREATVVHQLAAPGEDFWLVVFVRGTPGVSRPLFPVLPGLSPDTNATLADLVDGNLGEGGETVLAFSNPLYVDVDGDGWSPPGVRLTPP